MKKKLWISLALLFVIPGLLLVVSCAQKTVTTEPSAVTEPSEEPAEEKVVEAAPPAPAEEEQAQEVAKEVAEEEEPAKKAETIQEELTKEPEIVEDEEAKLEEIAARNRFLYEDIYFEFDKSNLLPMAQITLKKKAEYLYNHPNITIVIEGHCDERGTNEYNLALGDRRGESATSFLVDLGISPSRLTTISYGEERPVDPRHNREAWAKNRRAHFVIE
jgi:peptidoglycan-associated lipoprotein